MYEQVLTEFPDIEMIIKIRPIPDPIVRINFVLPVSIENCIQPVQLNYSFDTPWSEFVAMQDLEAWTDIKSGKIVRGFHERIKQLVDFNSFRRPSLSEKGQTLPSSREHPGFYP